MKTELLRPAPVNLVDARAVVASMVEAPPEQEYFAHIGAGEPIMVPNYFHGGDQLVVPSIAVTTFRGNQARIVDMHHADAKLDRLYNEAARGNNGKKIWDRACDGVVRILDTSGAEGLHHIHGTKLPYTVYYHVRNGARVYIARVGEVEDAQNSKGKTPVLAVVGAAKDVRAEHDFFRVIGSGEKKRYNP